MLGGGILGIQTQELKIHLMEINDLGSAASILHWDQTTYMPPGGAAARGRQLATSRLAEKFTFKDCSMNCDLTRKTTQTMPA